jgi:hypothetical protein
MDQNHFRTLLSRLSDKHAVRRGGPAYLEGFASAFIAIHDRKNWEETLQKKFFIPDETRYRDDPFYESACELTVANHIRQQSIQEFVVDKRVNCKNKKDVDVWFRIGSTQMAVEIKCPVEPKTEPAGGEGMQLMLKTAGRVPDHTHQLRDLKDKIESSGAAKVAFGKNKDLTLKDCLLSANEKFSPNSSVDNLNLLFLGLGYAGNISDWYMHLHGEQGLFTADGFYPSSDFDLVDAVILSNLRYWHEHAARYHDWTLRNVFLLPIVNPHARSSLMSDSVLVGLSVIDHHLQTFRSFRASAAPNVPEYVLTPLKANHYINQHLSESDRNRYFPIQLYPLGKAAPPH